MLILQALTVQGGQFRWERPQLHFWKTTESDE